MSTVSEILPYVERDFVIAYLIICFPFRLKLCESEGRVCHVYMVHHLIPGTLRGVPGGGRDGVVELVN